jgi:glycosyltransferase involved in cell wall biosynthesis
VTTVAVLALTDASLGGVWQYTRSMVDAVATDRARRYVVVTGPGASPYDGGPLEVRRIASPRRAEALARALVAARAPAAVRRAAVRTPVFDDVDVFLCPENSFFPHLLLDRPFVYTLHDLQERFLPGFFPVHKRLGRRFVRARLARGARHVLCESRFVKESIVSLLGVPADRITVAPSPPPRAFLDAAPSEASIRAVVERHHLPDEYLFYPAQLWHHKNHVRLLDAFERVAARHPGLHLVLTGSRQSGYSRMLARKRALGPLASRVIVLGYVDYAELPALYRRARMLVMPSLFESVSIPIWEAFAAGVPVCASRIQAIPEQVGDAGLLFDPTDPASIAAQIERLLTDRALAAELVARGRARIAELDPRAYAEQLVRVVDEASRGPRCASR